MSMLKSRKRSSCQTPEDKWGEIWEILFPGVKQPETPYNLDASLRAPSVTTPILEYEYPGSWWDHLAGHLATSLQDTIFTTGNQPSDNSPDFLKSHITKVLREYRATFPIKQELDHTMVQPKLDDTADLPGLSPHGSSGSCLSISTPDGLSDGDPWVLRSLQNPSLANFTYDTNLTLGTSPIRFASIDWNHGHSVPRSVLPFSMEGTSFLPEDELPPMEALSMGNEAPPTGSISLGPCDLFTFSRYPGVWSMLQDDTWVQPAEDEMHMNL
ncbi:hypothetical protein PG984_012952 [Apiospora sp. TS-2023a]